MSYNFSFTLKCLSTKDTSTLNALFQRQMLSHCELTPDTISAQNTIAANSSCTFLKWVIIFDLKLKDFPQKTQVT